MTKSILIGPVKGIPEEDSIAIIVKEILDKVPDNLRLFQKYVDGWSANKKKGAMLAHVKPHCVETIDDILIPLGRQTQIVAAAYGTSIVCKVVDRDIEMGDNEGDIPYTPSVGPRRGPPVLRERAPKPDQENWVGITVGKPSADWTSQEGHSDRAAARSR